MTAAIIAIALGVAGGFVAALAGVGGGIIFVPALALVLGLTQVVAEATSLLAIVPVAILGTWQQRRTGARVGHSQGQTVHLDDSAAGPTPVGHPDQHLFDHGLAVGSGDSCNGRHGCSSKFRGLRSSAQFAFLRIVPAEIAVDVGGKSFHRHNRFFSFLLRQLF